LRCQREAQTLSQCSHFHSTIDVVESIVAEQPIFTANGQKVMKKIAFGEIVD
jgi:hypothetical protein